MAFPVSPLNGATTTVNGITYTYASATNSWTRVTISRTTAGTSPPASPNLGDEWYDTSSDILFTRITDGTSIYWLDIISPSITSNAVLTISGDGTIASNLTLGQISNAQAISTTSGALKINGGVGINNGNLYISGSAGNAIVATGALRISGNIIPTSANNSQNLGSTTAWWGTYYGVSSQALYADLAENYTSDADYPYGTVVIFGGEKEVTVSTISHDTRVAGVVSENPAYLMNSGITGIPVAFTGRVLCQVRGPVNKGTVLVSSDIAGVAEAVNSSMYRPGCVIGKSLDTIVDTSVQTIEVVVGRF